MGNNYSFTVSFNSEEKKYNYHHVSKEELMELKKVMEEQDVTIRCNCESKIEMKIGLRKEQPYLYPAKKGISHGDNCVRSSNYVGNSAYEKAWKYDEQNDKHIARLNKFLLSNKEKKSVLTEGIFTTRIMGNGESTQSYETTLFGFVQKLNLMVQESFVYGKKKRLPTDNQDFMKHLYGFSNKVFFEDKKDSLQKMFLPNKPVRDFNVRDEFYFIYMEYVNLKDEFNRNSPTAIVELKDANGFIKKFYVDKEIFKELIDKEPHSNKFIVSGFVHRVKETHKTYLTLNHFVVVPITQQGLFVESSYEKKVYEYLAKRNLLFVKPYLPLEQYGGFIPDYIIIRENKKPIVGEIFGIRGNYQYEERKEEKINCSKTKSFLKHYEFEYWEV